MDDDASALYQLIRAAEGHDIESAKQVLFELRDNLLKSNIDPMLVDYVCKNLAKVLGNGVPMDVAFNLRRRTRERKITWREWRDQKASPGYLKMLDNYVRKSRKNLANAPAFTSAPVTVATARTEYTYNVTASDPGAGNTQEITAPTLPAWVTFTDNGDGTAALTGTPAGSDAGDHDVSLQVSDGADSATQDFTITVAGRRTRDRTTWEDQNIAFEYVEELSKRPRESTKIIGELAQKYHLADGSIKRIVSEQRKKYPLLFDNTAKNQ